MTPKDPQRTNVIPFRPRSEEPYTPHVWPVPPMSEEAWEAIKEIGRLAFRIRYDDDSKDKR